MLLILFYLDKSLSRECDTFSEKSVINLEYLSGGQCSSVLNHVHSIQLFDNSSIDSLLSFCRNDTGGICLGTPNAPDSAVSCAECYVRHLSDPLSAHI